MRRILKFFDYSCIDDVSVVEYHLKLTFEGLLKEFPISVCIYYGEINFAVWKTN